MTSGPRQQHDDVTTSPGGEGLAFGAPVVVEAFGLSHVGHLRASNEDHFLIARVGRYFETVAASLPAGDLPARTEEDGYALVVADGMGGHAAGEYASRLTIREMVRLALALPDWIVRLDEGTLDEAVKRSERRIAAAHELLMSRGRLNPALRGMGTTVTCVRNLGRVLQVAHVGDSRAYLLRAGTLMRLTRDHTYVQRLVDRGELTPEEAASSTKRHVLVNAVGGVNDGVRVDVEHVPLVNGDRVMLCSDGLSDLLDDAAIRNVLVAASTSEQASRVLVDQALAAGGRDNVTVVVATYRWQEDPPQT
jgi:protein phosphatase